MAYSKRLNQRNGQLRVRVSVSSDDQRDTGCYREVDEDVSREKLECGKMRVNEAHLSE